MKHAFEEFRENHPTLQGKVSNLLMGCVFINDKKHIISVVRLAESFYSIEELKDLVKAMNWYNK